MRDRKVTFSNLSDWVYRHAGCFLGIAGLLSGIAAVYAAAMLAKQKLLYYLFSVSFAAFLGLTGLIVGNLIQKLYEAITTDPLTGLGNRRYLYQRLKAELSYLQKTNRPFSLAFIDVDDFKHINDTSGHAAGDQVLVRIGAIFRQNADLGLDAIRWGGDEFVLIFPGAAGDKAKIIIDHINNQLAGDPLLHGVTLSIGLIEVMQMMDIDRLLTKADKCLYEAKALKSPFKYCQWGT